MYSIYFIIFEPKKRKLYESKHCNTMLVPTSKNISSFSCNDCLEEIIAGGRF